MLNIRHNSDSEYSGNTCIYRDMQYPIIPGLTSPGRLGARAPELSDIAYPGQLLFPINTSSFMYMSQLGKISPHSIDFDWRYTDDRAWHNLLSAYSYAGLRPNRRLGVNTDTLSMPNLDPRRTVLHLYSTVSRT